MIDGLHKQIGELLFYVFTLVLFYIFTVWMLRRMAQLSKIKYFQIRGIVGEHEFLGDSMTKERPILLGFFHPFCNSGGGGERVLWAAIRSLQHEFSPDKVRILVYTGDLNVTPEEILENAKVSTFGYALFQLDSRIALGLTWNMKLILYFLNGGPATLLLQSLASIPLGLEAFSRAVPDILVDTMGYAFIYPIFKWLGCCKIVAYVHYPIISSDMLEVVENGIAAGNNSQIFATNRLFKFTKIWYYRYFAELYGFVGRRADVIIANSTWTRNHLLEVWATKNVRIVYPPCDTLALQEFPLNCRGNMIVSVAQFRPEKNHELQLKSLARFLDETTLKSKKDIKLILIGGCRNEADYKRVENLQKLAHELSISNQVQFIINAPFETLKKYLKDAKIGLHSMWNEHFGIGIVEYQAAGCIVLAHKSGGPLLDIVIEDSTGGSTGFLSDSIESYADLLHLIFSMPEAERIEIATRARLHAQKFSDKQFEIQFTAQISELLAKHKFL